VIAAHAYTDPLQPERDRRAEAKALAQNLKAGTASAAEKDRLLLLLTQLVLGD
jgi:hypothetical protein